MRSDIDDLLLFAEVAERHSVTAAASALGLPKSSASRRLVALETRLATPLLLRSTRRIRLTDAGEELLEHAQRMAEAWRAVQDWQGQQQREPRGKLRIALPSDFAQHWLAAPIAAFRVRWPAVSLELDLSPRRVDVIGEGLDCAVRIGPLPDSGLVARKLTDIARSVYASPLLSAQRGEAERPQDLAAWPMVRMQQDQGQPLRLQALSGSRTVDVTLGEGCTVNSIGMARALVLAGAGCAVLPDVLCEVELQAGRLHRLLPGWRAAPVPAHLVLPTRRLPMKTRAFVEHLVAALGTAPGA
jgi:DNA-binding transcriptional LysR family regulator